MLLIWPELLNLEYSNPEKRRMREMHSNAKGRLQSTVIESLQEK